MLLVVRIDVIITGGPETLEASKAQDTLSSVEATPTTAAGALTTEVKTKSVSSTTTISALLELVKFRLGAGDVNLQCMIRGYIEAVEGKTLIMKTSFASNTNDWVETPENVWRKKELNLVATSPTSDISQIMIQIGNKRDFRVTIYAEQPNDPYDKKGIVIINKWLNNIGLGSPLGPRNCFFSQYPKQAHMMWKHCVKTFDIPPKIVALVDEAALEIV